MFIRRFPVFVGLLLAAVLAAGSSSEDVLLSKARSLEGRGRTEEIRGVQWSAMV